MSIFALMVGVANVASVMTAAENVTAMTVVVVIVESFEAATLGDVGGRHVQKIRRTIAE